jgi:hypothetical protein
MSWSYLLRVGPLPEKDGTVLSAAHVQGQVRVGTQAPDQTESITYSRRHQENISVFEKTSVQWQVI